MARLRRLILRLRFFARPGSKNSGRLFSLVAFVLACGLASGCGTKDSSGASAEELPPQTTKPQAVAPLPSLTCALPNLCPKAIGQLVTTAPLRGSSFCTVSSVARDLVITASHCVPWELLGPDKKAFAPGCWVRFRLEEPPPQGESSGSVGSGATLEEWIECKELVAATSLVPERNQMVQPDVALIRLSRGRFRYRNGSGLAMPRVTFNVKARVRRAEDFAVYGVHPGANAHAIVMQKCRHEPDTRLLDKAPAPVAELRLPNCPTTGGNSGGPLLDRAGRLVGIISFTGPAELRGQPTTALVATVVTRRVADKP